MTKSIREFLFGRPRDPLASDVFHRISLIAFLAWVGLGADGLSSACYGPEATYRALGEHRSLAPLLALMTVLTVSVLSGSYSNTIEAFPSGGGGYVVATRTLGGLAGVICGCALVLDYVLTVAISVAAGADAIFSLLPAEWSTYRLAAAVIGVLLLTLVNFRGVRESVLILLPIFVVFLVTHAILIALAIAGGQATPTPSAGASAGALSFGGAAILLLKAYSHGAGTYTGIEAVSNSLSILREPRVQTARRAMLLMAISLSVVAGGLLVGYLRTGVGAVEGKTLNAALAEQVFGSGAAGRIFVLVTVVSEATLLLIAAQAGFIDGPRVLASMAVDSWVPRWFSRLSDRLVVSNGILVIGVGGLGAMLLTRGRVELLVVLYSLSVFITFLLSQSGMTRHWFREREAGWVRRMLLAALAATISIIIITALLIVHGTGAAGVTLAIIVALGAVCWLVRRHYAVVRRRLARLNKLMTTVESDPHARPLQPSDPTQPTAVFLVGGYSGPGIHTLLSVFRTFTDFFRQMIFVTVAQVDFESFRGRREIVNLQAAAQTGLDQYVQLVQRWGYPAEGRMGVGVDVVDELERMCTQIAREHPRAIFFVGDLIYEMPTFLTRLLHERTADELQRRLHLRGLPVFVMPMRVARRRQPTETS